MTKPPDPARRAATMLALLLAAPCAAQADVLVGTGSTVHFADASIDFGCGNLIVGGTADSTSASLGAVRGFSLTGGAFALGSGTLALGGDFANAGKFAPGIGMVAVGDACGNGASTFSGANNFHALSITTTTGKQAIFPVGLAQNVTHALTLQGTPGNLLRIASSSAGQQGVLALAAGAAQNIAYVDARDNDAGVTPIAPGAASLYQSINGGDLMHWFDVGGSGGNGGSAPVPAPTLGCLALLLLAVSIAAFARKSHRAQPFGRHSDESCSDGQK